MVRRPEGPSRALQSPIHDEDGGDDVPVGLVADDAVDAHGSGGLDDDQADEDEVPEAEGAMKANRGGGLGRGYGSTAGLLAVGQQRSSGIRFCARFPYPVRARSARLVVPCTLEFR